MSPRQITVLGECVADAFTEPGGTSNELALRVLPGGGPANTAVALARLGTPARFLARLSGDVFGRLFRAHLEASGVDLSSAVRAAEPSTLAVAELDAQGQAAFSFHAQNTADWQWTARRTGPGGPVRDRLPAHRIPGPGPGARRGGGGGLPGGGRPEATISIDPNVRPLLVHPEVYRARLAHWCALADILRLSEDDLELLLPGTPPEQACDTWHAAGARLVVITRGADGALASLDGERVRVPAVTDDGRRHGRRGGLLHRRTAAPPRRPRPPRRPADGTRARRRRGSLPVRRPGRGSDLLGRRSQSAVAEPVGGACHGRPRMTGGRAA